MWEMIMAKGSVPFSHLRVISKQKAGVGPHDRQRKTTAGA